MFDSVASRRSILSGRPASRRQRRRAALAVAALAAAAGMVGPSRVGATYYTPDQIRSAYRVNNLGTSINGTGQTIGIIDFGDVNTVQSSLASFDSTFSIQAPASFSIVNSTGGSSLPTSEANPGETVLDVEYAHAIAPAAKIVLVEVAATFNANGSFSYNPTDLQNALTTVVGKGASVVSMSFGGTPSSSENSSDSSYNKAGVAFVASTGDSGTVNYPATSPYVIGVGGTSLTINGSTNAGYLNAKGGTYGGETVWNNSSGSGGGGYDVNEPLPSYQKGLGPGTSGQVSTTYRNAPDVAYDGDLNTGVITVFNTSTGTSTGGTVSTAASGGTSAGAPQWAGLLVLADQERATNGLPALSSTDALTAMYASLSSAALYSSLFNDVTTGATSSGFKASTGYDDATGLGSPVADDLVNYLATYVAAPEPTTLALLTIGATPLLGGRRRRRRVQPG